jgi:2-furoyl-CoA dehydrogenase large subunit
MSGQNRAGTFVGASIERVEDAQLLTGQAPFTADMPTRQGTLHAAILRSPHAHAEIVSIDVSKALECPGVVTVLTGKEIKEDSEPFLIVLKKPLDQWSLAIDRVRFVGESVAVVVAADRYMAEDALEHIRVVYKPLPCVVSPQEAAKDGAPLVHPAAGSNVVSERHFSYGDPDKAFAEADRVVELTVDYPRNSQTPMEGYVVLAEYKRDEGYDVQSNFQGPFTVHPVMSKALRIKGSQLRMRSPAYSGGGFGIKQAIFPYVVLMCIASKRVGRPVKWIEDRLEHLTAAIAAPNRVIRCQAAVKNDGKILGFRFEQLDDYGAYLRPPMPGPLYRQHGIMTGAYDVPNMTIVNRLVMTNKTPSGMVRGFGGPQIYYGVERLIQRVAVELGLDHLEVIRKNLIPAGSFPYRAAAGALIDSGDYQRALEIGTTKGQLDELKQRRDKARKEGRLYGIGFAAIVEPGQSNMGYLSTIMTVDERKKAGPKGGNVAYCTINVDPLGGVSVTADSLPQGQGHATVLSQIVADQLGLEPKDIVCNMERDTQRDPWSIATGNYSSRFSSSTTSSAYFAARNVRAKLAKIAAHLLNVPEQDLEFAAATIFSKTAPEKTIRMSRVAGTAHWSPGELPQGMSPGLSETVAWSPEQLEPPNDADQINTSLTYGFVFDFCGVEVDRGTGQVKLDRYVTMHDSGKLLNPLLAEGQVYGAFAWGVGCALYEEFVYREDGSFLSGTFADYLCPTAPEVPTPLIFHMESPSPFTPLGAKGIAEGNCMSTPVCIANAVADATGLKDLRLPLTPSKIAGLIHDAEPAPPNDAPRQVSDVLAGRSFRGSGEALVAADRRALWSAILDPKMLSRVIPGCHEVQLVGENSYRAQITLGVGVVKGKFEADIKLTNLEPPSSAVIHGRLDGALGSCEGAGILALVASSGGTQIRYEYGFDISGKVAAVGGRMLNGTARVLMKQFFERLASSVETPTAASSAAAPLVWWRRLLKLLGVGA